MLWILHMTGQRGALRGLRPGFLISFLSFLPPSGATSERSPHLSKGENCCTSLWPFSKWKSHVFKRWQSLWLKGGRHLTGGPRVFLPTCDSHQEAAENSREGEGISKTCGAFLKPAASPLRNRRPHAVLCICVTLNRMRKHKPTRTRSWTLHFTQTAGQPRETHMASSAWERRRDLSGRARS